MKQITCAQMGGPATCTTVFVGNTPEEIVSNAMKHVEETHPEMAADIKKMTPEETANWMADFTAKFSTLQDA